MKHRPMNQEAFVFGKPIVRAFVFVYLFLAYNGFLDSHYSGITLVLMSRNAMKA